MALTLEPPRPITREMAHVGTVTRFVRDEEALAGGGGGTRHTSGGGQRWGVGGGGLQVYAGEQLGE